LAGGGVKVGLQVRDGRCVHGVRRPVGQRDEPLLRGVDLARQELALRAMELERERQVVPPRPPIVPEDLGPGHEVPERGGVGGGPLGTPASHEVEVGDQFSLFARRHQRGAEIQLVHDIEDLVFERVR
jgi:hypothetical protein